MRAVVQRVAHASVIVDEVVVGQIGAGLLIFLGIGPNDQEAVARRLASRLARLRIFPDSTGRMNLSVLDIAGGALVVSQFTLFADLARGHRPSFLAAGNPELGRYLCSVTATALQELGVNPVAEGRFGAHMQVDSRNDGPVTLVTTSGEEPWRADCG